MKLTDLKERQELRFVVIGCFNTVLDFLIYNLLGYLGLPLIAANIISTGICMLISFILNRRYTFRSSSRNYVRDVTLFILFTLFGLWVLQSLVILGITQLLSSAFTEFVRINLAKLLATGVSMVWNFLAYKYVVFKEGK